MRLRKLWQGPFRIQNWLRRMVLVCILPSFAMAVFLIVRLNQREHTILEAGCVATARALMRTVDQELINARVTLQILATAQSLQVNDLDRFYKRADILVAANIFGSVILTDASGQQRVNTLRPFGETRPQGANFDLIRQVFETGQPGVSDLHIGSVTHRPLISVVVPVLLQGKPTYALTGGLYPAGFNEMLSSQHQPINWITAILDSTGTIVARSKDAERFVGQKAGSDMHRRMGEASEGVVDAISLDGVSVFVSYSRSPMTGWAVVIAIPTADLTADLYRSLGGSIAIASGLLIVALLVVQAISERLRRSIETLKDAALALATDQSVMPLEFTRITELSEVGDALSRASQLLKQRAMDRATAFAESTAIAGHLAERSVELERSNKDLEQFAYVTSHDLKAPLRAISHLVDWITEDIGATASPETARNLMLLSGRAKRMQALLDSLLAYSRIGHNDKAVEPVDPSAVVRNIVANLSPPPAFVVDCVGPMPEIHTRRIPLERVLENLIDNGIKHHDRTEGRITVSMRLLDNMAEFRVSDDGPGIPVEFHDRIFLIFQTLKSRDEVEGSGIGLAIVKRKVEIHRGRIRVESVPPARGSTFVFTWKVDGS